MDSDLLTNTYNTDVDEKVVKFSDLQNEFTGETIAENMLLYLSDNEFNDDKRKVKPVNQIDQFLISNDASNGNPISKLLYEQLKENDTINDKPS